MRAGLKWPKIVEKRRLLPMGGLGAVKSEGNGGKTRNATAVPDHPEGALIVVFHRLVASWFITAGDGETDYVVAKPLHRCGNRDVFDGMTMKGNQDNASGKTGAETKDSRQDRLKLALRENLKRRKSQARGRNDAASSENDDASLDTAGGKS